MFRSVDSSGLLSQGEYPGSDFVTETFQGFDEGKLEIPVGMAKADWEVLEVERNKRFAKRP
jgi:hypothetical protein